MQVSFWRYFICTISITVIICGSMLGCTKEEAPQESSQKSDEKSKQFVAISWKEAAESDVTLATAAAHDIQSIIPLPGEVQLNEDSAAHIHPHYAGTVKKVEKNLGDTISPGDVLAVVQSSESLAAYNITSEIKGTLIAKNISVGQFVKDDEEVFVVADLETVWISASLYQENFDEAQKGMSVRIKADRASEAAESTIDYISPVLSKPTRTQSVRVVLENPDGRWHPGMFVTMEVITKTTAVACAVPIESIVTIDDKDNVFVQTKDEQEEGFEARPVSMGIHDSHNVEITEGLKVGEIAAVNSFILKAELEKATAEE